MRIKTTLAALTRSRLSLVGSALVQISAILMVTLITTELVGVESNPYIGMVTYLFLPGILFFGAVLVLWGVRRESRLPADVEFPIIDFNKDQVRRRLLVLTAAVTVGLVFVSVGSLTGVHYMESNKFCGEVCHTVMEPEYLAHARSPHAKVHCVECHVGEGADWFVKAKLSGAWQLISVTFDLYNRPIETPVHNLRPSKGTCEQCHWPAKFYGSPAKLITRFGEDEANTETKTVLIMNIGGHDFSETRGIHWHMDEEVEIRYRADERRETVYEVELTRPDGSVTRYTSPPANDAPEGENTEWRSMDCVDCHNRPTHIFYAPDEALDLALDRGFIAKDLPFIKREGMKALQAGYPSQDEASSAIAAAIEAFYLGEYPEIAAGRADEIAAAGDVLGRLYVANVFPEMNLDWNTYPNHIGHERSDGCFRCHAGDHTSEDGQTISFDCRPCHMIVAWDEASPQILELLKEK